MTTENKGISTKLGWSSVILELKNRKKNLELSSKMDRDNTDTQGVTGQ